MSDLGTTGAPAPLDPEKAVAERYAAAARAREDALCCPVEYDGRYLEAIPEEVLERDYGCGDPSAWLRSGETVLDLGSGGGKICFIASQVVGPQGRVIGVDMNRAMLDLARRAAPVVAERIGYANVEFREGRIQDLAFDPAATAEYLAAHPVRDAGDAVALEAWSKKQRLERPLLADGSVDVVVSNCVLNLVPPEDKPRLFQEIYRVTAADGRVVISDVVGDEDVPLDLQRDPELWSGCISGALREDRFVEAFAEAGFHGVRILRRDEKPWRTVDGIEFRAMTVEALRERKVRASSDARRSYTAGRSAKCLTTTDIAFVAGCDTPCVTRRSACFSATRTVITSTLSSHSSKFHSRRRCLSTAAGTPSAIHVRPRGAIITGQPIR